MELTGEQQKQLGMDLVQNHNPDFVEIVRRQALVYAEKHGTVCADEMRTWAIENGVEPKHPNSWGAVFRTGFKKVGYRPSNHPASHGRIIAIWSVK